jgi:putative pyruvate formate lyase activating enzyme
VTTTKFPQQKKTRLTPQQSDIVIRPDGTVHISFLWDDIASLARAGKELPQKHPAASANSHPRLPDLEFPQSEYISCRLCPKQCGFNRHHLTHRSCGDSKLRVATYGLTQGDEPAIRGTRGSGAIMLSGCPLHCPSCHNPEMVRQGAETSIQDFIDICFSMRNDGAHNLQILSPTVHFPALRAALEHLKNSGFELPVIFKSSGYERVEELSKFDGLVDIYLPDLKFGTTSAWAARAGVKDYFTVAQAAIAEMIRQAGPLLTGPDGIATRGVLVRHVKAPLPEPEWREIDAFLSSLPPGVGVSVQNNFVSLE